MTSRSNDRTEPYAMRALKAEARALREATRAAGQDFSHSEALERLAHQAGLRDWNTLCALVQRDAAKPLQLGDRVAGLYLGQDFSGELIAAEEPSEDGSQRITVQFDSAVDVVRFESFSALRRRVSASVNQSGRTEEATSDGLPHMHICRPIWQPERAADSATSPT